MVNRRGLLAIGLLLVVLHVFFIQPAYSINGGISEHHPVRNRENNSELKGSSSRKVKGVPAKADKRPVLTVGGKGQFPTVNEAIKAVPSNNKNPVEIFVQPGIYKEKVTIPAEKPFITLRGSDAQKTVITWNDCAKSSGGTYYSATLSVYASDFIARNITIKNSYGPGNLTPDDQAVAVRISGDRCAFYDCRFLAYQDTVLDESGRHYILNCYIEGAIDVICGNGKSIYERCKLHAIPIDNGAFTAQRRSSASEDSGFVLLHCKLKGKGLMYLGRAWGPYSTVLYAYTYMDDIIFPPGWDNWNDSSRENTVFVGQFQCRGPGAAGSERVPWSHVFPDKKQIAQYLSISYIDGDKWIK